MTLVVARVESKLTGFSCESVLQSDESMSTPGHAFEVTKRPKLSPHLEEISVQPDGVFCLNDRLVTPPVLHKTALDDLHMGCMEVEKMKSMAGEMWLWHEMNAELRTTAEKRGGRL
ncbi:hypothetical protein PHET_08962 [Paragonimus heterotremus]|uniref:Uncharacterized protein n=1 Tax=Paragonimus heterotremus TaxID=100268 RepID=A0A8J4TAN7_9TREM|nr:hypothetical protein PHET_08962 [Paragonimus heterotremus]